MRTKHFVYGYLQSNYLATIVNQHATPSKTHSPCKLCDTCSGRFWTLRSRTLSAHRQLLVCLVQGFPANVSDPSSIRSMTFPGQWHSNWQQWLTGPFVNRTTIRMISKTRSNDIYWRWTHQQRLEPLPVIQSDWLWCLHNHIHLTVSYVCQMGKVIVVVFDYKIIILKTIIVLIIVC